MPNKSKMNEINDSDVGFSRPEYKGFGVQQGIDREETLESRIADLTKYLKDTQPDWKEDFILWNKEQADE